MDTTKPTQSVVEPNYLNKENLNSQESQLNSHTKNHLSTIYFSMCRGDLSQPWFHKRAIREDIESQLKAAVQGTFVIRPSSKQACYAMSWSNGDGTVSHNLIYNQFPGYSLKHRPLANEIFSSLELLVQNCSYLSEALPDPDFKNSGPQSSSEIIDRINSRLIENDQLFTSLEWTLAILEGKDGFMKGTECEWRTAISFSTDSHVAPVLFKLEKEIAKSIFQNLSKNTSVHLLKVTGHDGFMHLNFMGNIGDFEVHHLCESLRFNQTLTSLDLSNNNITDDGAKQFAQLLTKNKTIKKMKLNSNFITAEGVLSLAQGLSLNSTIEVFEIENQFCHKLSNVVLSSNSIQKSLSKMISDSLTRKQELTNQYHELGIHGYLLPHQAQSKIQHFIQSHPNQSRNYSGYYLFYVHPNYPNSLILCYTSFDKTLSFNHKPIYRTLFGYSFTRDSSYVPSLMDHTLWNLAAPEHCFPGLSPSGSLKRKWDEMGEDFHDKMKETQEFVGLWRIPFIENLSQFEESLRFENNCYPTLLYLVQRNKFSLLKHLVLSKKS